MSPTDYVQVSCLQFTAGLTNVTWSFLWVQLLNNLDAVNPLYTQQAVIPFLILCVMSADMLLSSFIIEPKQGKLETRMCVCVCVCARALVRAWARA